MKKTLLKGDPPIEVTLRRSARARRLSLRVSRLDRRVTLSMPTRARESDALAFIQDKEGWIRQTLSGVSAPETVTFGSQLPFLGADITIAQGAGRSVRFEEAVLHVPGAEERVGARVAGFLKFEAQSRLKAASDRYAALLGVSYARLSLRDTRSRWGSCTSQGGLMYSWRLVMAPEAVLDYVAAHEVAHLREMNHSSRFWSLVADVCPDYEQHRLWLRENGDQLHRWQFKSD